MDLVSENKREMDGAKIDLSSDNVDIEHHKKKVVMLSSKRNSVHHTNDIILYGDIVDVLGDGNCGFYAIKAMLVNLKIMDVSVSVSSIRKSMYEYVIKNPETVMKKLNILMRNSNMRDC